MDERLTALETHFNSILPTLATKADIEALRADMYKMSTDTHRWMLASMIGMFLGFGGLYFASSRELRPPPVQAPAPQAVTQQAAPPPVIIYNLPPDTRQPAK